MRLIDADALFEVLKGEEEYLDGEGLESRADGIRDAIMDVISAPTIEPVNVTIDEDLLARAIEHRRKSEARKKGKWIEDAETFYKAVNEKGGGVDADTPYFTEDDIACSECLALFSVIDNCTESFNYCPNCGADMRGEQP